MFTGLVQDIGTLLSKQPDGRGGLRLTIGTSLDLGREEIGASIATNGVCLTAEQLLSDRFVVLAGPETLRASNLGQLSVGARVHLEPALRVGSPLGGHWVQGHVDGSGQIVRSTTVGATRQLVVQAPESLTRYIAAKGSLCVDGVSLTVNALEGRNVRLDLVPHTLEVTLLGELKAGDTVNLEVDILAKYVERLLGVSTDAPGALTVEKLKRFGY